MRATRALLLFLTVASGVAGYSFAGPFINGYCNLTNFCPDCCLDDLDPNNYSVKPAAQSYTICSTDPNAPP